MEFIVAVDRGWGIGQKGQMLFHVPADLAFFKETTMGGALLMGRKTFESLPGVLPGRLNLVLTRQAGYDAGEAQVVHSVEEALAAAGDRRLFLIGGGDLYRALLDQCEAGYVTRIDAEAPADTYFPDMGAEAGWLPPEVIREGTDNGYAFRIERYRRDQAAQE
ncbi:dihydrofolate reductase [Peptococcus simiae]|uniref:Dihydrofolate reductase n=1 Tax=Peptococcus simiae TaxID=1643805 RepID=A0ABW9GZN8_9FIRM